MKLQHILNLVGLGLITMFVTTLNSFARVQHNKTINRILSMTLKGL